MKYAKKIAAAFAAAAFALSLTACSLFGHSYDPTQTGIYIASDKTITSAEITDFDNSDYETPRYDEDEALTFIQDTVKAYNKEKVNQEVYSSKDAETAIPVELDSFKVSDAVSTLLLKFASAQDYLDFFGTTDATPIKTLVVGTVADGISSGLDFAGMVDVEGQSAAADTIKAETEYTLVMVAGETEVQTEGKIVYYSSSLTKTDDYTVVSNSDDISFIIFK